MKALTRKYVKGQSTFINKINNFKIIEKLDLKQRFQLHPQVNLEDFVQQLPKYLTGADLYSLCSNAMLKNVERNIQLINKGKIENKIYIDSCLYVISTLNLFLALFQVI